LYSRVQKKYESAINHCKSVRRQTVREDVNKVCPIHFRCSQVNLELIGQSTKSEKPKLDRLYFANGKNSRLSTAGLTVTRAKGDGHKKVTCHTGMACRYVALIDTCVLENSILEEEIACWQMSTELK